MNSLGYYHGGYRRTSLYVDECAPAITGCRFFEHGGHGLELFNSVATVRSNSFKNVPNWGYPVVLDTLDTFPLIQGNTVEGTGNRGVYLPTGTVTKSGRWLLPGAAFPYLAPGNISVGPDVTLAIDPGVTYRTAAGLYVNGTLLAQGTATEPIVFTSLKAIPAAGG